MEWFMDFVLTMVIEEAQDDEDRGKAVQVQQLPHSQP